MRSKRPIARRSFLQASLAATAGAAAMSCGRSNGSRSFRFFSAGQAATVDAVCETLIPSDRDAGAHAAHVVDYIDIQLARHFRKYQQVYCKGIAAVEASSRAKFGRPFTGINADERAAVLGDVEVKEKTFFDLILAHTRQGFYGDPRHGGNYEMASWKMVGLPFPQVRGRMHYDGPKVG